MSWSKLAPTAKVCSRWHTVLRWASCISLWTAGKLPLAWPLSFAFTPLHAHILSDSTDCSYSSFSWQLLTISPERVSAVFKVLGKWFNIPIRREFLQIPRTNECCNKAKPPARQRRRCWFAGICLTTLVMWWYCPTLRTERSRAHIFSNLPLAKIGRGEIGFGFNVLHFQIYNATSYYFLTILKE